MSCATAFMSSSVVDLIGQIKLLSFRAMCSWKVDRPGVSRYATHDATPKALFVAHSATLCGSLVKS
jgi:hypothetical protein